MIGDSYYVLPSSTHELMIVPCKSGIPPEHLGKTVREVNENNGIRNRGCSLTASRRMTEIRKSSRS